MWGRKQRQIEELREQLRAAIEDQVTAYVQLPRDVVVTVRQLPKGLWYRVSFMFRVVDGAIEYSDAFVGSMPAPFDGDSGFTATESYDWVGRVEGD